MYKKVVRVSAQLKAGKITRLEACKELYRLKQEDRREFGQVFHSSDTKIRYLVTECSSIILKRSEVFEDKIHDAEGHAAYKKWMKEQD